MKRRSTFSKPSFAVIAAAAVHCTVFLSSTVAIAPNAAAQQIVHDPSNHAENLLAATRALEQIRNQVAQIEQQARMLTKGTLQLSPELQRTLHEAETLFRTAEGLAYDIHRLGGELEALYPETWDAYDLEAVIRQSDRWVAESRRSFTFAMQAEARAAANLRDSRDRIASALDASSAAEGQTSAVQAGNQLIGITATQLAGIETLMIAEGRARQAERMEALAREERAAEIQRRAFPAERTDAPPPARSAF
jgi:type IV secretion system protein TrbJ